MLKNACIILFFLLFHLILASCASHAQVDTVVQALENKIQHSANDTAFAKSYFELIRYALRADSAKANHYLNKLYDTAHSSQNVLLLSRAYGYKGMYYNHYSQKNLALRYYDSAMAYGRAGNDFDFLTGTLCNKGYILSEQQLKQQALESFIEAAKIAEHANVSTGAKAHATYSLGRMYYDWNKFSEAIPYFNKSLLICTQQNITPGIGQNNLFLGKSLSALRQHDLAIEYLENNLKVQQSLGISSEITEGLIALCEALLLAGNVQLASAQIEEAKKFNELYQPKQLIYKLTLTEIKVLVSLNKFEDAHSSLLQLLPKLKIEQSPLLLIDALELLFTIQIKREDFKSAHQTLKQKQMLHDSITASTNLATIANLEQAYKYSIQEKERHTLESKNEYLQAIKKSWHDLYYILLPTMFVLMLLLFIVSSNYIKLKKESMNLSNTADELRIHQARVEEQSALLKSRIDRTRTNPAFLALCLDSIYQKIKAGETADANTLLSKLSLYMRHVLTMSSTDTAKLDYEIELAETLTHVLSLVHNNLIRFTIKIEGREEAEEWSVPALLLCELAYSCSNMFLLLKAEIQINMLISSDHLCIFYLLDANLKNENDLDTLQDYTRKKLQLYSQRSDAQFDFNYRLLNENQQIRMELNAKIKD